jgi:hypothetical protein
VKRDRLGHLLAAAERITVDLVAQEPITVRPSSDTPEWARHVADSEQFDVLPVREDDGRIVRLASREHLDAHESETDWDGFAFDQIYPDDIVSATTPLLEVLERLSPHKPRLFVLGRRHIDGIATIYDLNQPAAHLFAFGLALVVEAELSQALEEAARRGPHKLDIEVDENLASDIENASEEGFSDARKRVRSWRKKAELGEQVRLSQELSFSDKIGLIEVMGLAPQLANRCRAPYGASGPDLVQCLKNEVKELRNAVAHDRGELADERILWRWMLTTYHVATDLNTNRDR